MEHFFFLSVIQKMGQHRDPATFTVRSELFLSSGARVDDGGVFACVAQNNAGSSNATFELHVVVPVPPKPPQVDLQLSSRALERLKEKPSPFSPLLAPPEGRKMHS